MNSDWSYSPETAILGFDLYDLDLWPQTLTTCMDITFGNNFWKFHDDTMAGTLWKRCDRQTERQTHRQTDRRIERGVFKAAWSRDHKNKKCLISYNAFNKLAFLWNRIIQLVCIIFDSQGASARVGKHFFKTKVSKLLLLLYWTTLQKWDQTSLLPSVESFVNFILH